MSATQSLVRSGEMKFKFVVARALNAKVAEMPSVGHTMLERAEIAAEASKNIAPVQTGAYKDSIGAELAEVEGMRGARIVAKDWKAGFIEFGTSEWPAHATLRRGAECAGLAVVDRG